MGLAACPCLVEADSTLMEGWGSDRRMVMKIVNISLAIVVAPVAAAPALAARRTVASPFSQDLLPLLPYLTLSPTN